MYKPEKGPFGRGMLSYLGDLQSPCLLEPSPWSPLNQVRGPRLHVFTSPSEADRLALSGRITRPLDPGTKMYFFRFFSLRVLSPTSSIQIPPKVRCLIGTFWGSSHTEPQQVFGCLG